MDLNRTTASIPKYISVLLFQIQSRMNINMKMVTNFVAYIATFMGLIAIFRYVVDGSLDNWVWYRSMAIAAAVATYNIWKNNKKGAYDRQDNA